jgi:hypothetical protein
MNGEARLKTAQIPAHFIMISPCSRFAPPALSWYINRRDRGPEKSPGDGEIAVQPGPG